MDLTEPETVSSVDDICETLGQVNSIYSMDALL